MVSDLHIGSGKHRDNFSCTDKLGRFNQFLDMVEKEGGQLLILGDFMDLWRFSFKKILKTHDELIARLGEMDCYLIPGNHDLALGESSCRSDKYSLFDRVIAPFSLEIGDRDVAFWHGHEVDKMNKFIHPSLGKTLAHSVMPLEMMAKGQVFNSDVFVEGCFQIEAFFIAVWNTIVDAFSDADTVLEKLSMDAVRHSLSQNHNARRIRRFEQQAIKEGKTIISAHTHQAGIYDNWYFNSGSWTTTKSDFLKVWPSGRIDVLKWVGDSQVLNHRVLA